MGLNSYKYLQERYYNKIRTKVADLVSNHDIELQKYESSFQAEIQSTSFEKATKKEFVQFLKQSDIILVGDFHAHPQSSRSLLRVLRQLTNYKVALGFECLSIDYQVEIDKYIKNEISEKEFLNSVGWKKNWGFPWEYTRPLFKWAVTQNWPILAINQLKIKNLKMRDHYSAELIKRSYLNFKKQDRSYKIVVQYGDFHLAQNHLPKKIKKLLPNAKIMVVFQSPDELFFKKIKSANAFMKNDLFKAKNNRWAVMSLLPWVKWQDYLLWLEAGQDSKLKNLDFEPTDHISKSIDQLSHLLKWQINYDNLIVYSGLDETLYLKIHKLPAKIKFHYLNMVNQLNSFYSPEGGFGFLARPSMNHLAKVSSDYILYKLGVVNKSYLDLNSYFLQAVWLEMITFFMSKLLNPKKKSNTIEDIRLALINSSFLDHVHEALSLALNQKMIEFNKINSLKLSGMNYSKKLVPLNLKKYNQKSIRTATQILGGILGDKLFMAFSQNLIDLNFIKIEVFIKLNSKNFLIHYFRFVSLIESMPIVIKSKNEKF